MSNRERPGKRGCYYPALLAGALVLLQFHAFPAADSTQERQRKREEKEVCEQNLRGIGAALQACQKAEDRLPNFISDLVPKYLRDPNVLTCPVSRRTGKTERPPLADPKIASSYLFEFSPIPLGDELPSAPGKTRREWRLKQVELLGPGVPVVRCRHHEPLLNLGLDGRVYESSVVWEELFTNKESLAFLTPAGVFGAPNPVSRVYSALNFPPRDPQTPAHTKDLSALYNALLTEAWHEDTGRSEDNLAELKPGLQRLAGIEFDVRGLVQLAGKNFRSPQLPNRNGRIEVRQKIRKLHFLHGASFGKPADEGQQIGSYVLSFVGQSARLEIPIVYGRDVRDWHWQPAEPPAPPSLKVAWHGENEVSRKAGRPLRLYLTSWTNLLPDLEVESIVFQSSMANAAPFLLAITVE